MQLNDWLSSIRPLTRKISLLRSRNSRHRRSATFAAEVLEDRTLLSASDLFPAPVITTDTGSNFQAVYSVDLDQNGFDDIVVLRSKLEVFLSDAAGGFLPAQTYSITTGATNLTFADVNNDGITDVLNNAGQIRYGNGDGTLSAATFVSFSIGTMNVSVGDLTGDGLPDLVTTSFNYQTSSARTSIFAADGTGNYPLHTEFNAPRTIGDNRLGDVNNDGNLDILSLQRYHLIMEIQPAIRVQLGNGDGTFSGVTTINVGQSPVDFEIDDINYDGKLDIVVAIDGTDRITVLNGVGDGTFVQNANYSLGFDPLDVQLVDINNDGLLDLATSISTGVTGGVAVQLGNADGTFGTPQTMAIGTQSTSIGLADVNNDNITDVALLNGAGEIVIVHGVGDGTFVTQPDYRLDFIPNQITAVDVTGDGIVDVVTSNSDATVSVSQGAGDGRLFAPVTYPIATKSVDHAVGDLTDDGIPDIIAVNSDTGSTTVSLLPGIGDGTYGAQTEITVGDRPYGVVTGDVNNDGSTDAIVLNQDSNDINVILNTAGVLTVLPAHSLTGTKTWAIASGDVNGDGILDVAVSSGSNSIFETNGKITILLGNGFGEFNFAAELVTGRTAKDISLVDVNDDGLADVVSSNHNLVSVFLAIGNGQFGSRRDQQFDGFIGSGHEVADITGDGFVDILVVGSTRSVLLLAGDGTGDFSQVARWAVASAQILAVADFNNDGLQDFVSTSGNISELGYAVLSPRLQGIGRLSPNTPFNTPTYGAISAAGEVDEWTFFGRAGTNVSIVGNPGGGNSTAAPAPHLGYANLQLLDSDGNILASGENIAPEEVVSLLDVELPANGFYRVVVRAATDHANNTGNYVFTVWDTTVDQSTLVVNQQYLGHIENPYSQDRWTFTATNNQQVQFDLVNASSPGLLFDLAGPGGEFVFQNIEGDSNLIILPATGMYVLTAHGSPGRSGAYAFRMLETSQIELTLGISANGTFAGTGHAVLYRVDLPESNPLSVFLNDSSGNDQVELYVRFATPPTRSEFDYRFTSPASAVQEILVPKATAGTWYILVYSALAPAPSNYILVATTSPLQVRNVTPDRHRTDAVATITVSGAGFDSSTSIELVASDGTAYPANLSETDTPTQITATYAPSSIPVGTYAVRVKHADGRTATLLDAFEGLEGGEGKLETNLVVPANVGRHAHATLYVQYSNTGTVAVPAPLLVLQSGDPDGSDRPLLTLDQSRSVAGFWTSAAPDGFSQTIQILASGATPGVLQPGESFRVPVYFVGLQTPWNFSDSALELELRTLTADDTTPMDWNSLKDDLRPPSLNAETWEPIFANLVTQVGTTSGDYVKMLNENASYLGRLGESVIDVGQLWAFELQQAIGLSPLGQLASAVDLAMTAPGLTLSFSRVYAEAITERFATGPLGRGWSTPWQTSLEVESDGSVNILGAGGARRRFQPDSRNGNYFTQAGDHGTLTALGGGAYRLRELNGSVTVFRTDGKLDFVEDTNGNRITAGYNVGQLTSLTHSNGASLTIAYNAAGLIESVSTSDNRTAIFTYDTANQHLIAVLGYDGQTTRYVYNTTVGSGTEHALLSIESPDGLHQFFEYDSHGRIAATSRDGNAEQITFGYNSTGKVTITDTIGGKGQLYFDHRGLVVKTADPLGRSTYAKYDNKFNLVRQTDETGQSATFMYDVLGNVIKATDQLGNSTVFTYGGPFNQLKSFTDARGNTTQYGYDANGNLLSTTYPNNTVERQTFDPLGNPLSFVNRRGQTIGNTYNLAGQVTRQSFDDGSHNDFTYDSHGNLLTSTDSRGVTSFEYDAADRMMNVTYPEGRFLTFTYDVAGRRTSMFDQDGFTTNYAYDSVGRLSGLTDGAGALIVNYTYDAAGRLLRKDNGNSTYTTYDYDAAGQMLHLANFAPAGTVNSRFDYTYDSLGHRVSMGMLDGDWTYTYDATGQLIHAVFASTNPLIDNQDLEYVYDALGNRIRTIENGVTTEYTTNNLNQYTTVGATTYSYDSDGNLISELGGIEDVMYAFNAQSRLVSVATQADAWAYEYDPFGTRIATIHNGQRTDYLLDPAGIVDVVGEYGDGTLIARYTHGIGLANRMELAGTTSYYDYDAIGSTVSLTGSNGLPLNRYSYSPFGELIEMANTSPNSYTFLGQLGVTDDSHSFSMRARFYDPINGRFTSADPLGIGGGDYDFYRYSLNDPVSFVDPTGEFAVGPVIFWSVVLLYVFSNTAPLGVGLPIAQEGPKPFNLPVRESQKELQNTPDTRPSTAAKVPPGTRVPTRDPATSRPTTGICVDPRGCDAPTLPSSSRAGGATSHVANAIDPNEKTGPAGFGLAGFVMPEVTFPYRIDFENDAIATAPAQRVVVTDQLDANLDWNTFELTELGFGDQFISVPAHSRYFQTAVEMTHNGQTFQVQIEVGIDAATGKVVATFQSIDPNTSLPPDVLTGFLPPEDGTGRGQGHVSYLVKPKAGLVTGTEIRNVALIKFDINEIITTNQVDPHDPSKGTDPAKEALNTIDIGGPSSSVAVLPAITNSASFDVNWSGSDDVGGSGIARYDVYVSDNGNLFSAFLLGTTLTTATFNGQGGHTYAFYSVATDNVGHREAAPAAADTMTTINLAPTGVILTNTVPELPEDTSTATRIRVANVSVEDDGQGTNVLSLSGPDAAWFELDGNMLYLRAGVSLDVNTKPQYSVTVNVDDSSVGATPDASTTFLLTITAAANSPPVVDLDGPGGTNDFAVAFVEDAGAVHIADSDATITDVENAELISLTLVINANPDGAAEILRVAGVAVPLNVDETATGIVGSTTFEIVYASGTRTFTVTKNGGGNAPIADFEALLRGITYNNCDNTPTTTNRTIAITANDGVADSAVATSTISVTDSPESVSLSVSSNTGSEAAQTVITITATASGEVTGDQTLNIRVVGAGITASDYVLSSNLITILDGQTTGTATFTIKDDEVGEFVETARIESFNPTSGIVLGPVTYQDIDITDNDTWHFDFVKTASATASGFTPVLGSSIYSAGTGFGWVGSTATESYDTGAGNPDQLLRDYHFIRTGSKTFQVDVPDGNYDVSINIGSTVHAFTNEAVYIDGVPVQTVSTTAGGFVVVRKNVTTSGGKIQITIERTGGTIVGIGGLTIIGANGVPVIATSPTAINYSTGDPATPVDPGLTVSDSDSANLVSASVSISGGFVSSEDSLQFTDQNGITGNYVAATGVLTLTGSSSVANYQAALRSVTYLNASGTPVLQARTLTFQVSDGLNEASAARTIQLNNPVSQVSVKFDFNKVAGANAVGFTSVLGTTAYNSAIGYGWTGTGALESFDTGSGTTTDVERDYHFLRTGSRTFRADVPNGEYDVTYTTGSTVHKFINVGVIINDVQVDLVTTNIGQFYTQTYTVSVTNGRIEFTISRQGGTIAAISGLEIAPTGAPLLAAAGFQRPASPVPVLTQQELNTAVDHAIGIWTTTGLSVADARALQSVRFQISNLSGNRLGQASHSLVRIDDDASGYGWSLAGNSTRGTMDLLSVVLHELGHVLGHDDDFDPDHSDDIMSGYLAPSQTRRLLAVESTLLPSLDSLFGTSDEESGLSLFAAL